MTRWNIKTLLFYSYDNRLRTINFDLKSVNIITGNSRTGKSTLVEVIDYVMGSSRCEIAEHVQSTCSWVGIVWSNDETEFVLCRRIPNLGNRSSQDYYFNIGHNVSIPESTEKLQRNIDRTNALKRFEQLLGIGAMDSETFGSTREPERISLRHVVPYMLQDDDTIINKTNLFRLSRQDGAKDIIDRIPYFVGVVDEDSVKKEIELRQLRARLRAAEKKQEQAIHLEEEDLTNAKSLALQAVQVGIADEFDDESSLDEIKTICYYPGLDTLFLYKLSGFELLSPNWAGFNSGKSLKPVLFQAN